MGHVKTAERNLHESIVNRVYVSISAFAPIVISLILWRAYSDETAKDAVLLIVPLLLLISIIGSGLLRVSFRTKLGILFTCSVLATTITLVNRGLEGHGVFTYLATVTIFLILIPSRRLYLTLLWIPIPLLIAGIYGHITGFFPEPLDLSQPPLLVQKVINQFLLMFIAIFFVSFMLDGYSAIRLQSEQDSQSLIKQNLELARTLEKLEALENLMSLCAWCGKVETAPNSGIWISGVEYLDQHREIKIERQICSACNVRRLREKKGTQTRE